MPITSRGDASGSTAFGDFSVPRSIPSGTAIPRVNGHDDVALIRTAGADPEFLRAAGARSGQNGWWVPRSPDFAFDALDPHLPRYARRAIVPLVVDLIPSSAWHSSLANILVKRSWDGLREETVSAVGGCEECGVRSGLECHEVWEYDAVGLVQRLVRLEALCGPCHETRHLGFANLRGRLQDALDRLCAVNRVEDRERRIYLDLVYRLFEWRSARSWDLDLSAVSGRGLMLRRALTHEGGGAIRGRMGERSVSFGLVATTFEAGGSSIVLI